MRILKGKKRKRTRYMLAKWRHYVICYGYLQPKFWFAIIIKREFWGEKTQSSTLALILICYCERETIFLNNKRKVILINLTKCQKKSWMKNS